LSADSFRQAVIAGPLDEVVRQQVFTGVPFAFRRRPEACKLLSEHVSRLLCVSEDCVRVVGSAKLGFSLNPTSYGAQFGDESDLDIMVVCGDLFDRVWLTLVEWYYPYRVSDKEVLARAYRTWASERRKDVFMGRLIPDRLLPDRDLPRRQVLAPVVDISARWFETFQSLSRYDEFAGREVNARAYRTWDHAMQYHVYGLQLLREQLSRKNEE
jgi:hypothetical protein